MEVGRWEVGCLNTVEYLMGIGSIFIGAVET